MNLIICPAPQLFFDDEHRNKEVESLGARLAHAHFERAADADLDADAHSLAGVTFCLVPSGVNDRAFESGLTEWRKRHPVEVAEDAAGDGEGASEG